MRRLRSKSVDLAVTCCVTKWSRNLLCGTDNSSLSPTFYSRVDLDTSQEEVRNSENLQKPDGTLKKLCDTIKRPFKSKSRSHSVKQDNSQILPDEVDPQEPVLFTAIAVRGPACESANMQISRAACGTGPFSLWLFWIAGRWASNDTANRPGPTMARAYCPNAAACPAQLGPSTRH